MGRKPMSRRLILAALAGPPKRWKDLHIASGVPKATVSACLKKMRAEGEAEPMLIEDEIHWQLTAKGRLAATIEKAREVPATNQARKELEEWSRSRGFSVEIRELSPNAWRDLAETIMSRLNVDALRPKDLPPPQFKKNIESYTKQVKGVVAGLWPQMIHTFATEIATMLISVMIVRAFLPSPLNRKGRQKLQQFIDTITASWAEYLTKYTREMMIGNFNYLEALVVLDAATRAGKIAPEEWKGKPPDHVIRKLQELKLIEILDEKQ